MMQRLELRLLRSALARRFDLALVVTGLSCVVKSVCLRMVANLDPNDREAPLDDSQRGTLCPAAVLAYLPFMRFGPIRRLFMFLVLGAFLCAGLTLPASTADAIPMDGMIAMSASMDMGDAGNAPMPCKSTLPNCFSSIGCIFMVALPPAYTPTSSPVAWSAVVYASFTAPLAGMSRKPDLGPPIHA